ncbi:unnamed protein product [Peronospora belbahrii]|uniref:Uncharacterized protein n=1 Tax=Peronospora belbahrii TaxID=622444 RepID=A0ABN8CV18_9STRA|nr:unnamed protein product [Peronospora belbahrii]
MIDMVYHVLEYLEEFPVEAGASELKSQLTVFKHEDLRAACVHLNLQVSRKQNKKGGFISTLVSYWKATKGVASVPNVAQSVYHSPNGPLESVMKLPHDVVQFVQLFPPHGHVEELQEQLNANHSKTLRSACVLLKLRLNKASTKKEFIRLLISYWQNRLAVPLTSESLALSTGREKENEIMDTKRQRSEEEEEEEEVVEEDAQKTLATKKAKHKALERKGDLIEERKKIMAESLEKAKVVKEWASAIEVLSHVDGSAESINSIRKLINGVVDSAISAW